MSPQLLLALLIQAAAATAVIAVVKKGRLRHTGVIFVVAAVVHHGITEIVLPLAPGESAYRKIVSQSLIDPWALSASVAILLFAVGYCGVFMLVKRQAKPVRAERIMTGPPIGWKAGLAIVTPLYLLALSLGLSPTLNEQIAGYLGTALVTQFLVILMIMTTFAYVVEAGGRHFFRALLVQSVAMALLGQRFNILVGVLVLLAALTRFRPGLQNTIRARHVAGALAVTLVFMLAISAARVVVGRQGFENTATQRIKALLDSLDILSRTAAGGEPLAQDFAYRFDGNSMPALVKHRIDTGTPPLGAEGVEVSLRVTVPKFLYPEKEQLAVETTNEETAIINHYGIPAEIDWLPSFFGTIYSYEGEALLFFFALMWGMILARLDIYATTYNTVPAFFANFGVTFAVASYEQTTTVYFVTLRTLIVLYFAFSAYAWLKKVFAGRPATQLR